MKIRFACGHEGQVSETATIAPICHCGERQIVAVAARPPRFRGACSGPYAETMALDPVSVDLTTKGALRLKPPRVEEE